jgi:hypothetical protein
MLRWMPTSRQQRVPRPAIVLLARCPALHEATRPCAETSLTFVALGGAKARGVALGSPKLHVARSGAVSAVKAEADRYAANVLPVIREAQKAGATTLRDSAKALNARGVATARGGQWHAKSISNILERA